MTFHSEVAMANESEFLLTPVGRLVQGSPGTPYTKDATGRERDRPQYFMAVAFEKRNAGTAAMWQKIHAKALAVASAGVKRFPREYPGLYEDLAEAYRHAGLSERNPAALKKALDIARDGLEIFPGYERLVEVRASIEDDASFLEDDLRMDEWRKIFRESSLMEDKRPILVMLRFELGGDSDDQLFETMHDYLARKPWFQAGKMYDYDDADKVILYRKNVGMGLDDYLETTSKVKRGAKVVFLEVDGRRVEKLSPKTIELCKERPFTILQCTLKFNEKETRVTGAKWTRLAGN
jgi:hypothetical protein